MDSLIVSYQKAALLVRNRGVKRIKFPWFPGQHILQNFWWCWYNSGRANIAQLVEQTIRNRQVESSILSVGSKTSW